MRNLRILSIVLLGMLMALPINSRSAKDAAEPVEAESPAAEGKSAESAAVGGRGEGFQPAREPPTGEEIPATFGPIVTDTAIPVEKGQLLIQTTFGYSFVNHIFDQTWRRASAGGNFQFFATNWRLTYGLIENMEVFVVIPYAHNWARKVDETGPGGKTSGNSGGLADVNLTLKYRLVTETETIPTVTALFATTFPTGKFKNLDPRALNIDVIGGGAYVFTSGFNVSKYLDPFIVYGNLWYSLQTSYTNDYGKQYPGDFVTINLAAEYPITKKWIALLELISFWGGGRLFGPQGNLPQGSLVSIIPGMEYMATDKFSVALGLNIDLVGKNTGAAVTPLLSMIYAF
jgi:hypothetical protein